MIFNIRALILASAYLAGFILPAVSIIYFVKPFDAEEFGVGHLLLYVLVFAVLPWLMVRQMLRLITFEGTDKIILLAFSVSAFGLVLAYIFELLGNEPGDICYVIQMLHGAIVIFSIAAFFTRIKSNTVSVFFIRACGCVFLLSGWFTPMIKYSMKCAETCVDTGWEIFRLSLFDLNILVSMFMGFFILMAVSKLRTYRRVN